MDTFIFFKLVCLFFETREGILGLSSKSVLNLISVRMVSALRKLTRQKNGANTDVASFGKKTTTNTGHNPENISWVPVPAKMFL
jgi:hypothetical protein